jgi:segregation and condensation protein B
MKLESIIEAILFYKAEPLSIKKIAELTESSEAEVNNAISELKTSLSDRGIVIVEKENEVMLGTNPVTSTLIEKIAKEELSKDLGKAGLETLSIILYKSPVSRSEIDYIRGVNSSFIVRNLLIRGLVERIPNPKDSRGFLYKPTFELMSHLGLKNLDELPDKGKILDEINKFENSSKNESEKDDAQDEQKNAATNQ